MQTVIIVFAFEQRAVLPGFYCQWPRRVQLHNGIDIFFSEGWGVNQTACFFKASKFFAE